MKLTPNEAIKKIQAMDTISDSARYQMENLVNFCTAMGGSVETVRTPEDVGKGYEFAWVSCWLPGVHHLTRIQAQRGRLEMSSRASSRERPTTRMAFLTRPLTEPPEIVVHRTHEKRKQVGNLLTDFYLSTSGIDYVNGDLPMQGWDAGVQRNGGYVNIAVV